MKYDARPHIVDEVSVEITVVIGRAQMPIHNLLRMGRGAVISLETNEKEEVEILANDVPVAYGHVIVQGKRLQIEVTRLIKKPEVERSVPPAKAA